jgi:hypothetical protein
MVGAFFRQMIEGFARLAQNVVFPGVQLRSKVSPLVCTHEFFALVEDEIAKIDLLTQRDSPEEHLKARCISPQVMRFKPAGTYPRIFLLAFILDRIRLIFHQDYKGMAKGYDACAQSSAAQAKNGAPRLPRI